MNILTPTLDSYVPFFLVLQPCKAKKERKVKKERKRKKGKERKKRVFIIQYIHMPRPIACPCNKQNIT